MSCPWWDTAEFVAVCGDVMKATRSSWRRAADVIRLWRFRRHRIPLGPEVTLHLLEAALASREASSTLSGCGALVRFLNLVSQLGERRLGLTKFHESAAVLGVPEWLVRLRHDASHGDMPAVEVVSDGVEFALRWVVENYWRPEMEAAELVASEDEGDRMKKDADYRQLERILECYGYLKMYSIWGTKTTKELKEKQPEVHEHLSSLWARFQLSRPNRRRSEVSFQQLKIRDGVELAYNELDSFFRSFDGPDDKLGAVVKAVMLKEDLLLPKDEEFLESILEDDDSDASKDSLRDGVPAVLWSTWADAFALLMESTRSFPDLLRGLFDVAESSSSKTERDLAAGWIVSVGKALSDSAKTTSSTPVQSVTPSKKRKRLREADTTTTTYDGLSRARLGEQPGFDSFVDYCLDRPSELLLHVLPHLATLRTPAISEEKISSLSHLIESYLGEGESVRDFDPSKHDLGASNDILGDIDEKARGSGADDDSIWSVVDDDEGVPSSRDLFEELFLPDEDEDRLRCGPDDDGLVLLDLNRESEWFRVPRLDWREVFCDDLREFQAVTGNVGNGASESEPVPAFYRNPSEVSADRGEEGGKRRRSRKKRRK